MSAEPLVSIVIPCHNEKNFIGTCLDSIVASDYPKDRLEVLIVDGMSGDGTREILDEYVRKFSFIRLLDNPKMITPAALNVGIANAKGEVVMRVDAHSYIDSRYITKSVENLYRYNADSVGGVWRIVAREETIFAKAIALSLGHKFGIGDAHYRTARNEKPKWVDTVPFFCCLRKVLDAIGPFNENLVRGQDMEFNLRLRKAKGRILLVPDIVSYYFARSDMKSFWKHNWLNGVWAILPFLHSDIMPVSWRHLVPLAFVVVLLGSIVLAVLQPSTGFGMLLTILGLYGTANILASAQIVVREKKARYLVIMPVVFAGLHAAYGLGSLWGLLKAVRHKTMMRGVLTSEIK